MQQATPPRPRHPRGVACCANRGLGTGGAVAQLADPGGYAMNRRTFEMVVLTIILMQPALGVVRLWAHKKLVTSPPGSLMATVAEDVTLTVQR